MENAFWEARNVVINATDAPDLSNVTTMESMFDGAVSVNSDLNHWDVSNVENMRRLFFATYYDGSEFNGGISSWDVSNVTQMAHKFENHNYFNGTLCSWEGISVDGLQERFVEV